MNNSSVDVGGREVSTSGQDPAKPSPDLVAQISATPGHVTLLTQMHLLGAKKHFMIRQHPNYTKNMQQI